MLNYTFPRNRARSDDYRDRPASDDNDHVTVAGSCRTIGSVCARVLLRTY
jgi:hypothetical protein